MILPVFEHQTGKIVSWDIVTPEEMRIFILTIVILIISAASAPAQEITRIGVEDLDEILVRPVTLHRTSA
jgi:hypothetical protein